MVIGLALVIGLLGWPAPDDARRVAEQIVADEALQPALPEAGPVRAPPRFEPSPRRGGGGPSRARAPASQEGSVLGEVVLWSVGGLLLVGLIAVGIRERLGPRAPQTIAPELPSAPPPPPERSIIDEADALAAAGRFAEAVHALLLRTIEALGRHMPVPRALTSREIQDRAGLPDTARAAFADLVLAVELTRFGGRPADADDYARCVACFDRIRAALGAR